MLKRKSGKTTKIFVTIRKLFFFAGEFKVAKFKHDFISFGQQNKIQIKNSIFSLQSFVPGCEQRLSNSILDLCEGKK